MQHNFLDWKWPPHPWNFSKKSSVLLSSPVPYEGGNFEMFSYALCFRILAKCGIRSAASLLWRRTCADDKNAKLHSPKFCSWRTFQHWTWIENGSHLFSALMYSVAEKTENIAAGFCNQEGASQMVAKSTLHLQEYIVKRNSGYFGDFYCTVDFVSSARVVLPKERSANDPCLNT